MNPSFMNKFIDSIYRIILKHIKAQWRSVDFSRVMRSSSVSTAPYPKEFGSVVADSILLLLLLLPLLPLPLLLLLPPLPLLLLLLPPLLLLLLPLLLLLLLLQ